MVSGRIPKRDENSVTIICLALIMIRRSAKIDLSDTTYMHTHTLTTSTSCIPQLSVSSPPLKIVSSDEADMQKCIVAVKKIFS